MTTKRNINNPRSTKVTVSRFLLIYFRKDKSLAVSPFSLLNLLNYALKGEIRHGRG
jgi:hypothetical protein